MADGNITVKVTTQAAQAELERLRAENAALKRDLQYARDGLTKGRTRMREDNERMRAALEMAVRQNEHDMLMTGEELRACRAALAGPGPNGQAHLTATAREDT